ncbi:glycosyltransferase [Pseudomonas shirazensis]|uniref:glycosyltransferase n=1 Tax=Pseudomonas shirazensis TaxID=2745494 RepID=UPI003D27E335
MTEQSCVNTLPALDISVLLLGSADHEYRARASAYLAGHGCQPRVVDASSAEQLRAGLGQALEQLNTPLVVLARDTDLLLPEAMLEAQQWLAAHPQVQGAQGYALGMRPGNSTVSYHRLGETAHQQVPGDVRERVLQHALSGLQPWRAVLRIDALRAALAQAPDNLEGEDWLLGLAFALLGQGEIHVLAQTMVVCECFEYTPDADALAPAVRALRQWDEQRGGAFADEDGFAILRQFVLMTGSNVTAPLLFVSPWASVVHDPVRAFEPRQYVELPYYNAALFQQLSALEFLVHAWPVGKAHVRAVEGAWIRQRDLLQQHPSDNPGTLRGRYWQALSVNLFAPQVCQLLLETLAEDSEEQRRELESWLARLQQVGAPSLSERLARTPSGAVLQTLAAATLDAAGRKRVQAHLASAKAVPIALLVLDLEDDNEALQRTFDSIAGSGLRDLRIVVLKAGGLPAITTARDTLHFVKVTADTVVSHLNQLSRQLPSDWLMLLQAGDELAGSGLLRLQVELAQAAGCQAVCGNEVQRDSDGRLIAVQRPGADFDLLRSRPDLMAPHWLIRREVLVQLGGYRDACRQALDFDLLLRLVEAHGMGGLAHVDEYLVVGCNNREAMLPDALLTLDRHLTQLGYRGQIAQGPDARLQIDFRHPATPLVSILLAAGSDMQQLASSLASIQQRTRYPRYEVLVVTQGEQRQEASMGGRVKMLACPSESLASRLNMAAIEARGDYLVLLSDRSQVSTPGWIEALLNQAQRPEVGVVGCQMYDGAGHVSHAGYELLDNQQVHASWLGCGDGTEALGLDVVRASQAVSADGLMVRKQVFDALGGLSPEQPLDIALCLQVAQAGLLVLMAPQAQLFNPALPRLSDASHQALAAHAPWAFARAVAADGSLGIARPATTAGPQWLHELI